MARKNFSFLLAKRYLKPKRTYVSVITLISIVGVMLGVGVLMIVIAVMAGFEAEFKKLVLGIEPHLTVVNLNSPNGAAVQIPGDTGDPGVDVHWQQLVTMLEKQEGVERAYPIVSGMILLTHKSAAGTRGNAAEMRAIDESGEARLKELNFVEGEPDVNGQGVAMSFRMANDFGIRVGDEIDAVSSKNIEKLLDSLEDLDKENLSGDQLRERRQEILAPQTLEVTGIFESDRYKNQVFVGLNAGRELYDFQGDYSVHGVALTTTDAYKAKEIALAFIEQLPDGYGVVTWMDQHQAIFNQIRTERGMMYFVLSFIVLVAAFSIMNTMITVTVQKNREIGVMKAMGARVSQIVSVFLIQGFTVGVIGTALGYLGGLLVIFNRDAVRKWFADTFGLDLFPEEVYGGLIELPALIHATDTMIICGSALFLCTIAALPPAYFVARLDPAKALRGTGTMS